MSVDVDGSGEPGDDLAHGWTVIDAQVPRNELVLAHRLRAIQARSAARLRPSRFSEQAVGLARRATDAGSDIDSVVVRRGERERQIAKVARGAEGIAHSVAVWIGPATVDVPPEPKLGAWTWVLDRRATYWSDDLFALYGIERRAAGHQEIHEFLELLSPEDAINVARLLTRVDEAQLHCVLGETFSIQPPNMPPRRLHAYGRIAESVHGERLWRGTSIDVTDFDAAGVQRRSTLGTMLADPTGLQSALVELPSLRLLRWISRGLPEIAWPAGRNLRETVYIDLAREGALQPSVISQLPATEAQSVEVELKGVDGHTVAAQMRVQILEDPSSTAPALVVFQVPTRH